MKLLQALTLMTLLSGPGLVSGQDAKGYALLVGVSRIDDDAYHSKYKKSFSSFATSGVGRDIGRMKEILSGEQYEVHQLLDEQATNTAFLTKLKEIGKMIKPDDKFLLYYSGHGDSILDLSGDELSAFDQSLVTYNDYTLDDSIDANLNRYYTKSRNVMIIDACHSGSSYKTLLDFPFRKIRNATKAYAAERSFTKQSFDYSTCSYNRPEGKKQETRYSLIYFGAASDDASAYGGPAGGDLTIALHNIYTVASTVEYSWSSFTYEKLACKIGSNLGQRGRQILQYHEIGPRTDNFKTSQPFKIK